MGPQLLVAKLMDTLGPEQSGLPLVSFFSDGIWSSAILGIK